MLSQPFDVLPSSILLIMDGTKSAIYALSVKMDVLTVVVRDKRQNLGSYGWDILLILVR